MALSSSKSIDTSLSPFLLTKGAYEAGKHEKESATKVHQMMPRASNDALGRMYTSLFVATFSVSPTFHYCHVHGGESCS